MKRHTQVNQIALLIIIAIAIIFGFLTRLISIKQALITNLSGVQLLKFVINDTPHSLVYQTTVESKNPLVYTDSLTNLQQKSISEEKETPEEYLVHGLYQVASGNWVIAEELLSISDRLHSGNQVAKYWLGYAYYKQNKIDKAIAILASVNAVGSLAATGDELFLDGFMEESSSFYELAIRVGKESEKSGDKVQIAPDNRINNFMTARRMSNIRKMIGTSYNQLGEINMLKNMVPQAIIDYEQALTYYPDNLGYRYNLSQIYIREGMYGKAIEHLNIVNKLEPGSAVWLGALGEAYLMQGDLNSAKTMLLLALSGGNDRDSLDKYWHARSYYALGTIYCQKLDWRQCLDAYSEAVRLYAGIDPSWEYVLIKHTQAALHTNSKDLSVYLLVGDIYFTGGKFEIAYDTYREAELLWPENPEIQERISSITKVFIDHPITTP